MKQEVIDTKTLLKQEVKNCGIDKIKYSETSVKQETKNCGIDIGIKREPVDYGDPGSDGGKTKADPVVNEDRTDSCIKEEIDSDGMNGEDEGKISC